MLRKIIEIDEKKCNGCGACAEACHEGAIAMIDGKAKLVRIDHCDGLGDCLPACPTGAITFAERDVNAQNADTIHSCPGSRSRSLPPKASENTPSPAAGGSCLAQWPCQLKLVPENAPYFDGAKLLIAADCTAYAYARLHADYMKGRITLIGCPKLDNADYSEKLTRILRENKIRSVTIVRMEVPCCGGLEHAVKTALASSGSCIPWQVVTIGIEGDIVEDTGRP